MSTAARVKALRSALKLSQDELAARAGHGWERHYVSKIERGANKASSYDAREALAQGFGLSVPELIAYLDGRAPLAATTKLARAPGVTPEPTRSYDPGERPGIPRMALAQHPDWEGARAEVLRRWKRVDVAILDELAGATFSHAPERITATFLKQLHDALETAKTPESE